MFNYCNTINSKPKVYICNYLLKINSNNSIAVYLIYSQQLNNIIPFYGKIELHHLNNTCHDFACCSKFMQNDTGKSHDVGKNRKTCSKVMRNKSFKKHSKISVLSKTRVCEFSKNTTHLSVLFSLNNRRDCF